MSKFFFLATLLLLVVSCTQNYEEKTIVDWPETSSDTKPWTRWWWHGSAVDKEGITANLEELKKAGFGGVEITPIYGVKGYEDKDISFLSEEWMEILDFTLKEGKRLNLGIDLANASGWPFGGPWISADDACKNVQYKIYDLKAGEKLTEKIEFIQKPLVRAVGHKVDISEVNFPISSNNNLQELALDQVRFKKSLPLVTLIAYNKNEESINLTDLVDDDGNLNWIAKNGDWKLYAIFEGWHGKMVERAGKGGEGNVIDHFSEEATKKFLNVFDENARGFEVEGLRAFFNDSYEVDDAMGESNWTPLFFEEFNNLRGYDLRDYLPALFGNADEETNQRVLCDYRETISDLLLKRFTITWREWSRKYNSTIRNQAHGSPANILDLYAESDIPETEGTSPLRIKMATSAGNVSGKSLIACEAATWLDEHFLSDLGKAKQNFDRYLANGVNHIVYHGTPYSPVNETWPGWMFYASTHFAPTNTWWKELETINNYVNNCQTFLQSSQPANDILLYYPIYDKWSTPGNSLLEHFGTHHDDLIKELSDKLLLSGYSFDYISDNQIQELHIEDDRLVSHNSRYKTILIPNIQFMPVKTFSKLLELVNKGVKIVIENNLPIDVPGMKNLQKRNNEFSKLKESINFNAVGNYKVAKNGNGEILLGTSVNELLTQISIYPEELAKDSVWFNKVNRKEGDCYFISNWSEDKIDKWIEFNAEGEYAVWFNPMNKKFGKAKISKGKTNSKIYVQLEKGESLILQFYNSKVDVESYPNYQSNDENILIDNEWEIEFISGGPTIPETQKLENLISWTELSDELKTFSGTAKYTTNFSVDSLHSPAYKLELGDVYNSAVVYLNGEKISTLVGPIFSTIIPSKYFNAENHLQIYVTNLMANRIIDMEKREETYKKFYNINFAARKRENLSDNGTFTSKNWEPLKSGLIGPIKLAKLSLLE